MNLTLAQMEAFFWTARLGSTVAAAAQLGLTQPSVSLRLQDFRRATGVDAFRRTPQGLRLTAEGRRVLEQVAAVLDLSRAIRGHGDDELAGVFRLGLAEAFAVSFLPRLLPELKRAFPALRPEITVAASWELEEPLLQGRLDLAVLADPIGAGLRTTILGTQAVHWVASQGLDVPGTVTPELIRDRPIIVNPPGSAMHRRMTNWFGAGGAEPRNVDHCSSGAVILHLVAAGVALSLAPASMVRCYARPGDVRILSATPDVAPGHLYLSERSGAVSHASTRVSAVVRNAVGTAGHLNPRMPAGK